MVISQFSFYYEVIVMFKLIDGKNPKTHKHTHTKKPHEAKSFVKSLTITPKNSSKLTTLIQG
jgi:hypothetical protein